MATYQKFNIHAEDINEGVHNMASHQLRLALSLVAPVATNSVLTDLTEIAYTNLSGDPTSRDITLSSSAQSPAGTYNLTLTDLTLTAAGGAMNAFRYVSVFNLDTAVKADPLICFFDYGSSLTLNSGESLTIDWESNGPTTGILYSVT